MGFRAKYGLILEDRLGTDIATPAKLQLTGFYYSSYYLVLQCPRSHLQIRISHRRK